MQINRSTPVNETPYPSGPEIVKIDGSRIKAIREAKGLTQLYVATAVEVTTDTVSRWENKRYPTIKKDNALKLAAALEVDLSELLDLEEPVQNDQQATGNDNGRSQEPPPSVDKSPSRSFPTVSVGWRLPLIVAGCVILGLLTAAMVLFWYSRHQPADNLAVTVLRKVPPHFVSGRPFPVFLHIIAPTDRPVSIIIRETIPPGMRLGTADPQISGQDKRDNSIKWLTKVGDKTTFFYTLISDPTFSGSIVLEGTFKVTGTEAAEQGIAGDHRSIAGLHHWADADRDNRISDDEILAVYDAVGTERKVDIDMDLIEDIWLGDGYHWDPTQQRFIVKE